ncbi:vWA domain-containing protein [Hymenobacter psychrophilus]|uniref:Ca-activated chloride channel family protein n=1 Tax=Hymenobacter psychrophilus TaxID=651662 RepID=A0A1H3JEA2_9BACT|nr:VWA domain-containing protein [Hymenobacter psychrophilus]SDY38350.1 Ca-activated chloride channel family protein [Hymenobacter psychrophilus]
MHCFLYLALVTGLLPAGSAMAQPKPAPTAAVAPATYSVNGRVTDRTSGQGLPGVTVLVKGTSIGVSTLANGTYQIEVPQAGKVLVFNSIGFVSKELKLTGQKVVDVGLQVSSAQLSEVVVTGNAPERQTKSVSYSAATIQESALQGRVSGVSVGKAAIVRAPQRSRPSASPVADMAGYSSAYIPQPRPEPGAGDTYASVAENGFRVAQKEPLSTFSIDVDAASYSNVRRFLQQGQLPPPEAVRVEEMLNYFQYDYPQPAATAAEPFRVLTEQAQCPWNPQHQLVQVALQARRVATNQLPPANLVFLVDVSGSMDGPDRLGLVQQGLKLLVQELRPQDKVALVVYAGAAGTVLPPTAGSEKATIRRAIDNLSAGGSTAGGAGLRLAYDVARQNFNQQGNNRVIICSDGDFNVGEQSDSAMERLVVQQRESGVFLTVLGVGRGNYQDQKMELLADKGNGNYAYLDNLDEARRVLVRQFGGTLFTLAQDVKLQVEFNPARVREYRLVGYENRLLAAEDFNNDRKDAGELGSGHTVTALYEIVPVGAPATVDALKYQPAPATRPALASAELLTVKLRYKEPRGTASRLLALPLAGVARPLADASENLRFAAAVAQFGMLLRQSEHRGSATYEATARLADGARRFDPEGYRAELVRLVRLAEGLQPAPVVVGAR